MWRNQCCYLSGLLIVRDSNSRSIWTATLIKSYQDDISSSKYARRQEGCSQHARSWPNDSCLEGGRRRGVKCNHRSRTGNALILLWGICLFIAGAKGCLRIILDAYRTGRSLHRGFRAKTPDQRVAPDRDVLLSGGSSPDAFYAQLYL